MDVCDAIDEAEAMDEAMGLEQIRAQLNDVEAATDEFVQDFKYPVDAQGRVMMVNLLNQMHPDLLPTLSYHYIRNGWRKDHSKRMVKQLPVVGSPIKDLVAYVPLSDPDDPIVAPPPVPNPLWTVGPPKVNQIEEKRSE